MSRWLQKNQERSPLLLSVDVYRPAAREQLAVIGKALYERKFTLAEALALRDPQGRFVFGMFNPQGLRIGGFYRVGPDLAVERLPLPPAHVANAICFSPDGQAMYFAVDRNLIAKTVYYGYARPGTSPLFSPNKEFFTPDTFSTQFDPKKAAALLDAAGYPKKADGKRFSVNLLAAGWFAENGKIGAIVKQGLEDIGVAVNLTVPDRPT